MQQVQDGGAGNPGGAASSTGSAGSTGTGGLLIIYADVLRNLSTISSNGSAGGSGFRAGGGGSGGGSINIFANYIQSQGSTTVTGGAAGLKTRSGESANGGAGGAGSASVIRVAPDLVYPDKSLQLNVGATYNLDKSKLTYKNHYEKQTGIISVGNIKYEILDDQIATVNSDGKITALKEGKTRVKITDETNKISTYIYLEVINNIKVNVQAGKNFTVALKQNGTVWSYGLNANGQLGIGNNEDKSYPEKVVGLSDVKAIAVGYSHALALTSSGELYSWGLGTDGQLGNGEESSNVPIKVNGIPNIVKIDAYKNISLALDNQGRVYVWGQGYSNLPMRVIFSESVIDISGTLMLTEGGEVYNISDTSKPITNLSNIANIAKISAGEAHYLAMDVRGTVYAWGTNTYGECGTSTTGAISRVIAGYDMCEISAGNQTSIMQGENGKVYVTGNNANGQLGLAGTAKATAITELKIMNENNEPIDVEIISSGEGTHSAIAGVDGYVWQTGLNTYGELGTNDQVKRTVFTKIGDTEITVNQEDIVYLDIGEQITIICSIGNGFNLKLDLIMDDDQNNFTLTIPEDGKIELDDKVITAKNYGTSEVTIEHIPTGKQKTIIIKIITKMESLVQGFRDVELENGDYEVLIKDQIYNVELINYEDDMVYTENTELGDGTTEYKTLVVKYHGDLTVNEGVTLTAKRVNNLTYKKGMYICVLGNIYNDGTISMTARGTYNAAGQDVYLWKNIDDSYEYVDKNGGAGGASISYSWSTKSSTDYSAAGKAGVSGEGRATGGGGSGALTARRANYSSGVKRSGAGSAGTSWSGGTGGGGINTNYGGTHYAGNGAANGGAGRKWIFI